MTQRKYAAKTTVSPDKSQLEIKKLLLNTGAERIGILEEKLTAVIIFELKNRRIMFRLSLPNRQQYRSQASFDQDVRQRWRSLVLVLKAKLEAVSSGLVTLEEEFLAHTVMPDGSTFGSWALPQVAQVYQTGQMPPMLPGGKA
jgi:hypothetical protein